MNKGRSPFNQLVIGLDPGEHVGLALEADGMLLFANEYPPPFDKTLVKTIKRLLMTFSSHNKIIRIGRSPRYQVTKLLRYLLPIIDSNIQLELVNEGKTSTGISKTNSDAALIIARRKGKQIYPSEVKRYLQEYEVPKGRIKEIKQESRIRSKHLTIQGILAREVAEGRLTLEQALSLTVSLTKNKTDPTNLKTNNEKG